MTAEKQQFGHFRRNWVFYALILVSLSFSAYLWMSKNAALKRQAKAFALEKNVIIEQVQQALDFNDQKHLEMMMKTFVWAVRGEMTRDNLEQVDQYFKQLVKVENIKEITLVDKTGMILISSNKKNEGNQLAQEYTETILKMEEITIMGDGDKKIAAAPVMSLDSRMGSLLIIYQPEALALSSTVEQPTPKE